MMLASEGLPKSAPDGNSMIDNMPMGASRAVEGEKLRGARELDLARTIEAIDSVESARVHLAVEPPSVFLRDRTKPSASVMLRLASGRTRSDLTGVWDTFTFCLIQPERCNEASDRWM